ncbi:FAD-dependent oxidoreductase [Streptomyces sp. SL13]|uniref:FAD-dependent oxidoreductase n=1 Tax=Streptantibioticus silvisoli TaxID=2705255 RepID=A0AA90H508_9ACTN|nr:FAD-dependent oxidoreductase [Streptantibioticus silvisoli]MDI5961958.1 FAD-dependent oxidoreductase [Streptantibioticus silvisoli]MDI5970502.1 FAD-dependent oxidoreductase [Streptantibioticus silvisoli]
MDRRRIAVVGSGVAGLTAAYVMRDECEVTLYEAGERLGGHALTREVTTPDGRPLGVDVGFIVHNERTYPHLLRLFRELGVATQESEMSMSVRCDGCGLEYAGAKGLAGLFPRPRNALRGRYLSLLAEVPRFHRRARALLRRESASPAAGEDDALTLGEFLKEGGFPPYFVTHFMTPLVSSVWSCAPETAMRYPARYLFRFLDHHGMLSVTGAPRWRTVTGGSVEYVDRVAKQLPDVRTSSPVRSVQRFATSARVVTEDGTADRYDAVVLAVHPDQALRMLDDPTPAESRTLGAFRYSLNPTVLHTDTSVLPHSRGAAASWNYLMPSCDAPAAEVRVSYDMNRLQRLRSADRYVVSLNATDRIAPQKVLSRVDFEHPVYTPESVTAQRALPALNTGVTVYAGAYHGWGFHEDGCRSGVRAAAALGVDW